MLYYKSKAVKLIRQYTYKGVLMAEIEIEGEKLYKRRSVLTESPVSEDTIYADELSSAGSNISSTVYAKSIQLKNFPESVPIGDLYVGEAEAVPTPLAKKTDDKMHILPTESNTKIVTATKMAKNKSQKIGEVDSDQFNKFIASNKLSKESVMAVLEGKQRTHKGFSFNF